jgi:hypothetical protein
MMNILTPDIGISLLAVIISIINFFYTRKVNRKRLAFEEEYYKFNALQLKKEHSASLVVSQYQKGNSNRLVIKNAGKAEARKLSIDIPSSEGLTILTELSSIFPLERLSPDESVELLILLNHKGARKSEIFLNWSDDSGPSRSEKHYITW